MLFSGNLLLNNVELIVRYCWMEEPYWMSFIKHHHSLGVKRIHIILQSKKDIKSLESFTYPRDLQISINYFSSDLNPDQALLKFDIEQFKQSSKYKLILDCDEFIFSFKKDLKLHEIIDKKCSLDIRWVMNPITDQKKLNCGFFGDNTKPLALSESISTIKGCHQFNYVRPENKRSIDATKFGLVVIHHWSRSLIDCLLRSSFSNMESVKTVDKSDLIVNLKKGILNNRTKYLAFLDVQDRYIKDIDDQYISNFNTEKELELILEKYNLSDIELYFNLYKEFKHKLMKNKHLLENYPPLKGNSRAQISRLLENKIFRN